jgi:hypothetical protein
MRKKNGRPQANALITSCLGELASCKRGAVLSLLVLLHPDLVEGEVLPFPVEHDL